MILLAGSSHPALVDLIRSQLMLPEHQVILCKFSNGEINVDINVSVREQDVFVLQTGFGSINDSLMELLIMIHACKISAARRGKCIFS
jgi:ribose-phosphate pyrophosphokinase